MEDIRVAVVGAGRMGLTHAENLSHRVRGVKLVAATTSNDDRAAAIRQTCGDLSIYTNLEALLEAEQLDAMVISSSTSAHTENIVECAKAGMHIFSEKPLALTLSECDRAIVAAENAKIKLMMGHVRQFDSGHVEAKRMIGEGAIGKPLVIRSISGDMNPPPPSFADPAVSGGLLLDALYHDFYLSRWLMDDEIIRVYTEGDALVDEGVRSVGDVDNAVVSLRFAGGGLASSFVSRTTRYGHDLRMEVVGDQGAVQIGYLRQTPVRLLDHKGVHHDTPQTTPDRFGDAFVTELQAFVDCIIQDTDPPITGTDSRNTVAVGIAATKSMQVNTPVDV
ncbi:MAG: Gfo/Idh/MocA family oxidoreductase [Anaerolineales bacterium]|nr:Gfo/Idh/MocA family oxidoreductase [Anaerolineales bacterium]